MGSAKLSVLVVDDSLFIRTFLSKILSTDPDIVEIRTANDGMATLAMLTTFRPSIITLDIEMPKMNGLDTLKVIKQKYNIPVIMVSSVTRKGADITIKALEMGAVDWIQKPENTFDSKV
ncbi:MAG: response regulator, partial [Candidatus Margulisiibacteriota bacterium]